MDILPLTATRLAHERYCLNALGYVSIVGARTCFTIRSCSGVKARPLPPPPPAPAAAAAAAGAAELAVADGRRRTPGAEPVAPPPCLALLPLLLPVSVLELPLADENGAECPPDRPSLRDDPAGEDVPVPSLVPAVPLVWVLPLCFSPCVTERRAMGVRYWTRAG